MVLVKMMLPFERISHSACVAWIVTGVPTRWTTRPSRLRKRPTM